MKRESQVQHIEYHAESGTLSVVYRSRPNIRYEYLNVPPLLQSGLAAARSKGSFLHRYIIPHKKVRKVEIQ